MISKMYPFLVQNRDIYSELAVLLFALIEFLPLFLFNVCQLALDINSQVFCVQDCYLVYILTEKVQCTTMVFTRTCNTTNFLALVLQNLGIRAIPLNGDMKQVCYI